MAKHEDPISKSRVGGQVTSNGAGNRYSGLLVLAAHNSVLLSLCSAGNFLLRISVFAALSTHDERL